MKKTFSPIDMTIILNNTISKKWKITTIKRMLNKLYEEMTKLKINLYLNCDRNVGEIISDAN